MFFLFSIIYENSIRKNVIDKLLESFTIELSKRVASVPDSRVFLCRHSLIDVIKEKDKTDRYKYTVLIILEQFSYPLGWIDLRVYSLIIF